MTWYEWAQQKMQNLSDWVRWDTAKINDHERRLVSLENWRVKAMALQDDLNAAVAKHLAKEDAILALLADVKAQLAAALAANDSTALQAAVTDAIAKLGAEDAKADEASA